MARQRFARILDAAKLYSAVDNYIKYVTDSTKKGHRVGQGKKRAASQKLYLKPFGQTLATDQKVRVTCALPTWTAVSGIADVNTRVSATPPSDSANIIKLEGFRPARLIYVKNRSQTGVAKTSAVTGLKYLSYGGTSTSFPFGFKTGDAGAGAEQAAYEDIAAAILVGIPGTQTTWQKERV